MFDITAGKTSYLLNKMADYTALRQKVIANNIANVNTPGYQRLDVSFDKDLNDALESDRDIRRLELGIEEARDDGGFNPTRSDGNTVDIDKEIAEQMKNTMAYNVYIEFMSKKYSILRNSMRVR